MSEQKFFEKEFEEEQTRIRDWELGRCPCSSLSHEGSWNSEKGSHLAKDLHQAKWQQTSDPSPPSLFHGHLQVQFSGSCCKGCGLGNLPLLGFPNKGGRFQLKLWANKPTKSCGAARKSTCERRKAGDHPFRRPPFYVNGRLKCVCVCM